MSLNKICSALIVACGLLIMSNAEIVVDRYEVSFPNNDIIEYQGEFKQSFPDGIPVGIGSGLYFIGEEEGALKFITVTDRGANADSPKVNDNDTKIFVTPNFAPLMMEMKVDKNGATAFNPIAIKDQNGPITGLPLPSEYIGSTHEIALSETLEVLESIDNGLDMEGIVSDGSGGYWVSDEYGPFIVRVNSDGLITEKYGPTPNKGEKGVATGLPNIIKWRQPNRGFEGIARLPDGNLVIAVQSGLNIEGKTVNTAEVTRFVLFNPETKDTKMIAYPIDVNEYKRLKDAKIGDIVAVDQENILLIEQGKNKNGEMRNLIYKVNIANATDLTATDEIQPVEFNTLEEIAKRNIKVAEKELLIDLREYGWRQDKAEGLALIDERRIAVINDNDFGVQTSIQGGGSDKIKDYMLNKQMELELDGKKTDAKITVKPSQSPDDISDFWLITFPSDI